MSETRDEAVSFNPPRAGAGHELLKEDVGTWDADILVNVVPGTPPQGSKGVAHNRLACGGLWLITEFMNETTGFEGHGIYGYDQAKGKFVGTWVDPMRTFIAVAEGAYDAAAKTMTMRFETTGPQGKPLKWHEITERKDNDTRIWRSIMSGPGGQEFEVMTVTYKRRK
jgi:hypothetical protein